ncbi:hypothetical protein J2850_004533 [Azospirillum picis]|uniref:Uncharacterized protein n=1 Tax=Azospirillum picis TaxID=488438 RepID=A0ABU0MP41_9PROT|nr:hypothetical protein [Azospirillum picis]MDQ0535019.1 hypothetical protein [Azospirillum picis]
MHRSAITGAAWPTMNSRPSRCQPGTVAAARILTLAKSDEGLALR